MTTGNDRHASEGRFQRCGTHQGVRAMIPCMALALISAACGSRMPREADANANTNANANANAGSHRSLPPLPVEPRGPATSLTDEVWNPVNNPLRLNSNYERTLSRLPLAGSANILPWSDTYWPSFRGGISHRWNLQTPQTFGYTPYTAERVRTLSQAVLRGLSPAEKYDIFMGRFDYPTVYSERRRVSPNNPRWWGLCHGWAAASVLYAEPKPVVLTGPSGIAIPFGASDVKALLTYYQGEIARVNTRGAGARCNLDISNNSGAANRTECRDVNAGTFHVILANQLGLQRRPIIADVTRDLQVWNQPIYSFNARIRGYGNPSSGSAPGTVREAIVDASITYADGTGPNYAAGVRDDTTRSYSYRLELDGDGRVLGGQWLTRDRPDFFWIQTRPSFTGYFASVFNIYRASVGEGNETTHARTLPDGLSSGLPDNPDVVGYER